MRIKDLIFGTTIIAITGCTQTTPPPPKYTPPPKKARTQSDLEQKLKKIRKRITTPSVSTQRKKASLIIDKEIKDTRTYSQKLEDYYKKHRYKKPKIRHVAVRAPKVELEPTKITKTDSNETKSRLKYY